MLIKKLAVPLVNEKILVQAEHCYIATASISSQGFDFIRSRIPQKTKLDILIGVESLSSPEVLKRILRNYTDRVTMKFFSKNTFHANLYIFDLPYRKSVAFIGSGSLSLEGLKDHEEIFHKISDAKEIEGLKSWFMGYFEFAEQIEERFSEAYEQEYYRWHQREIATRKERSNLLRLTSRGFNWEGIRFKNQFFSKDDFLILSSGNATSLHPGIVEARNTLEQKLLQLAHSIEPVINKAKLYLNDQGDPVKMEPASRVSTRVTEAGVSFGKGVRELKSMPQDTTAIDFLKFHIIVTQTGVEVLFFSNASCGKFDRENLLSMLANEDFKGSFYRQVTLLGEKYFLGVAGERKPVTSFTTAELLMSFLSQDQWRYYDFEIGRSFGPGDTDLAIDKIQGTIESCFTQLLPIYDAFKAVTS
jgi:hypothetical protein